MKYFLAFCSVLWKPGVLDQGDIQDQMSNTVDVLSVSPRLRVTALWKIFPCTQRQRESPLPLQQQQQRALELNKGKEPRPALQTDVSSLEAVRQL